jgi:hypothetical protein
MESKEQGAKIRLRLAVMHLGCAPQAQRRYVQLGLLQRAAQTVEEEGGRAERLLEAGVLDRSQAELVASLRDELAELRESTDDYMHERVAHPREFLFGHALEEEGWRTLRHLARSCFMALREDREPAPAAGTS